MRKKSSYLVVISGLLVVAGSAALIVRVQRKTEITYRSAESNAVIPSGATILHNHGAGNIKTQLSFTQTASLSYFSSGGPEHPLARERKLKFFTNHSLVRYDRTIMDHTRSYLFDGQTMVRTTFAAGTQLEVKVIEGAEANRIKIHLRTCGLLPVLKHLSDPNVKLVNLGPKAKGHRFRVTTSLRTWYLYLNADRLIERLEDGDTNIQYGDYRTVEGLVLPFYQEVKQGDRLIYRMKFESIDLHPVFAPDTFKSNLL